MPTYAYACTACDHRFEAQQSFADDALTDCPQCQGQLRKLFNSVGIVFKGSGFYRTDSRGAKAESSASASTSDSSDSSTKKSDSSSTSSTSEPSGSGSTSAAKPAAKPASSPAA